MSKSIVDKINELESEILKSEQKNMDLEIRIMQATISNMRFVENVIDANKGTETMRASRNFVMVG